MADITCCLEHNCPRRKHCYRYTAEKDDWQSYFAEKPCEDYMACESFWDNTNRRNVSTKAALLMAKYGPMENTKWANATEEKGG